MSERHAIAQLTLARMRESVREPGVLFWVFGFPILLSVGLGLAFRTRGPEPLQVGVLEGNGAAEMAQLLGRAGMRVQRLDEAVARGQLRAGRVALVVVPDGGAPGAPIAYRFDPMRDEARLARAEVDAVVQRAAGRTDPRA